MAYVERAFDDLQARDSNELIRENDRSRRTLVEEWADYVRTHGDESSR